METSRMALGRSIRALREAHAPRLSQEELGRRAGYRTGAGVSMSRIENGVTRPSPRRLAGIAAALGVDVADLEGPAAGASAGPATSSSPAPAPTSPDGPHQPREHGESGAERMRRIQGEFERRQAEAVGEAAAFNAAHDRARDEFFLPLVAAARSVSGLPALAASAPSPELRVPPTTPAMAEAVLRRELATRGLAAALSAGVGPALQPEDDGTLRETAYNDVVAAAVLRAGPTDHPPAPRADPVDHPERAHPTTRPEPSAGAAARATRALLAGSRPLGGPRLVAGAMLTSFVATAASPLLAATTLAWIARRSRRQSEQLRRELDQAELDLASSGAGFTAVMGLLRRATERLDYIALHGGHAQRRWTAQLPPEPRDWSALRPDQQAQLAAFVELAACQVCVDTIDMTELLAAVGAEQDTLVQVADAVLSLTQHDVERLV